MNRRRTISIQEHHSRIRLHAGVMALIGFIALQILGNQARSQVLISPLPSVQDPVRIVEQVKAVEVEVPVYVQPETIEEQIMAVFGDEGANALKVAKCESGLNPKSANKTSSARGLFQVMQSWHKIDQKWLFNPEINIHVAHTLWQEQGWEPWRKSNHCHKLLK